MEYIVKQFGFVSLSDFLGSFIRVDLLGFTIPFAALAVLVEQYLGLRFIAAIAFTVLVFLEFVVGVGASVVVRKEKFDREKLLRFGLKFFVWITLFFILNSFKIQWNGTNLIVYGFFDWLYDFIVSYVVLNYLVSVLENLAKATGKTNNILIEGIKKKIENYFNGD